jgi:CheY-like chemotaxis protein
MSGFFEFYCFTFFILGGKKMVLNNLQESQPSNYLNTYPKYQEQQRENHQLPIDKVPIVLSTLLDACLATAENEFKSRAKIVKRYKEIPKVLANQSILSRVLNTILIHSAKSLCEANARRNMIKIATGEIGDQVYVEITNNGKTNTSEKLTEILESIYSTAPNDRSCGKIEIINTEENGNIFRVWLAAEEKKTIMPDSPNQLTKILIIDDEESILRYMRRILRSTYTVLATSDSREAISIIAENPDINTILCDLTMPEVSGMDLYEMVKERYPQMAERFVFMSGGAYTNRAVSFLKEVTNPNIEKPIDNVELLEVIKSFNPVALGD